MASEFHNGSDNLVLLVHATRGTVDSPAVAEAGLALTGAWPTNPTWRT